MSKFLKGYSHTALGQIHFRQCRQVAGTPLVLLHQTASSGLMFEPLMGHLAADFPTIAPDTPGFGNSFTPDSFTMGELAAALHAALSDMGLEQCYLLGHHTGAALTVQMAYDYPKLARWLVLSGPPLLSPEQVAGLQAGLKPFALMTEGEHLLGTWQRIRQRDPALPLEVVQRELLLTQMAGAAAVQTYHAVFAQPFAEQLAALDIPILVLCGEHDTLRPSLEPAYRLLRQGHMAIIPGAGPYLCDTHPQVIAELVREFAAGVDETERLRD
ncbi:MAG: alpha/beta hydrolase [Candidatus Promineifilaceae bacterium]